MKNRMHYLLDMKKPLYIFATLITMMLVASCTGNDEPAPVPTIASFNISSHSTAGASGSNELICDWWVILADNNGRIAGSAQGDAGGVERQSFEINVNTGTYKVYAFANISRDELCKALSLPVGSFDDGATLPVDLDTRKISYSYTMPEDDDVPMSGKIDHVTIIDRVHDAFSVEVVRMWGKLEFEFSNSSKSDIEVLGITFGPLQSGPLSLFAPADLSMAPVIDVATSNNLHEYTFVTPAEVAAGAEAACTRHLYVHESVSAPHPTGKFHFSVKIKRDGQPGEELFALTEDLTWINRNDYIQIPIDFMDWSLRYECRFAPPIGGYPTVLIEVVNHEYYIKFGSSGRFTLTPYVKKGAEGDYLSPDRLDFNITSLDDPNGILAGPLTFEDGSIVGNLTDQSNVDGSARTGTAAVGMSVRIKEAANGLDHVFTRKFYIIREKK